MPETELFNQRGAVTEQIRSGLRTHEGCYRVGLTEKIKHKSGGGGMAVVSDPQCFQ